MHLTSVGRSTYLFPVSTSQQRYGFFAVTKDRGQEFLPEDVELLGISMASHLAVALECAVARDSAERYQRQVAKERDRLKLLLEINNHIVSKLDVNDLFQSASASIRSYFHNDSTRFWLLDKQSNQLERVFVDFPDAEGSRRRRRGSNSAVLILPSCVPRVPELWSSEQIEKLPASLVEPLKAESIISMAVVPLATANGPLGVITLGSRRPSSYRSRRPGPAVADQHANRPGGRKRSGVRARLRPPGTAYNEERLYLESEISSEYNFEDIIGKSATFQRVLEQVSIVAPTDSTVVAARRDRNGKGTDRTSNSQSQFQAPAHIRENELRGHPVGAT